MRAAITQAFSENSAPMLTLCCHVWSAATQLIVGGLKSWTAAPCSTRLRGNSMSTSALYCSLSWGAIVAGVASEAKGAHLFLQRILYRINRLVLFWCACASASCFPDCSCDAEAKLSCRCVVLI